MTSGSELSEGEELAPKASEDISKKAEGLKALNDDKKYNAELKNFEKKQSEQVKKVQKKITQRCKNCVKYIRSKIDNSSMNKHNLCFSCFTAEETHKLESELDSVKAEEFSRIGNLGFSDFEEWLFGDELGERCLTRILVKVRREGFDFKPWQLSIGATAWMMDNYTNTTLSQTRHILERSPIAEFINRIPENGIEVGKLINNIRAAEETIEVINNSSPIPTDNSFSNIPMYIIGAISFSLPFLIGRGRDE